MANDFAFKLAELLAQSRRDNFGPMQTPQMNVPRGPDIGTYSRKEPSPIGKGLAEGIEKAGDFFMRMYAEPKIEQRIIEARARAFENTDEGKRKMAFAMFQNYWNMTDEQRLSMEKDPAFQQLLGKVQEVAPALVKKRADGTYTFYEPIPTEIQMRQRALYDAGVVATPPKQEVPEMQQYWDAYNKNPDLFAQIKADPNLMAEAGRAEGGGSKSGAMSGMNIASMATGIMGMTNKSTSPKGPEPPPKHPAADAYAQLPTNLPGQTQDGLPMDRNKILFAKEYSDIINAEAHLKSAEASKIQAELAQKEFDNLENPNSPQGKALQAKIRYYNSMAAEHYTRANYKREQVILDKDENSETRRILKDVEDSVKGIRSQSLGRPTRADQSIVNGHYLRAITDISQTFPETAGVYVSKMLSETHNFYLSPKALKDVPEGQIASDLHQVRRAIALAPGMGVDKEGKKILRPEDVDYYCRILESIYQSPHKHLLSDSEIATVKSYEAHRIQRMAR